MANRLSTEAWQSPTDISLEKSVECLGAVSRIPSGSERPDRCLQATEELENRKPLKGGAVHRCIRPRGGASAPGHDGYPRASDLISG